VKINDFIKKLQNKPEHIRKLILWIVVIITGLILVILWAINVSWNIKKFQEENLYNRLNLPAFEEALQSSKEN